MIVKNEERALPQCLDSVGGLAPELVVVDTGSTDGTLAIAASHGALVTAFDFSTIDFAAARNCGLSRARGRWILVLDADEILMPGGVPLIRDLVARNDNAGYYFERLNRRSPGESPTTDYVVRLFPNKAAYRYRGRVHETVDDSILAGGGRLLRSDIRIDHAFAPDAEIRRQRNLRYSGILREEIAANPSDYSRLDFLAAEYHQLGLFEEAAEVAESLAGLRPHDPRAHLHAGVYRLLYKPDRDRARMHFMEALRLRPVYPEAQSFLQSIDADTAAQPP